jgi:hypothetical protein
MFLGILGMVSIACAQTLTANEMIEKTKCKEVECIKDFITTKGFTFKEHKNYGSASTFSFQSDKSFTDESGIYTLYNSASIWLLPNNENSIVLILSDKDYYQNLLDDFRNIGFRLMKNLSETTETALTSSYNSSQFPGLTLTITTRRIEAGGYKWTSYELAVSYSKWLKGKQ